MKSVLFVCHGNICRSPMAEYIFKYLTDKKFLVESRATSKEELGNDMHPKAKRELDKHNIPYDEHFAKQITIEDYNKFDIIVCFDDYNIYNLQKMFNKKSKIIKLLDKDIDDPWYNGNFIKTYEDIYNGCIKLKNILNNKNLK